VSGPLRVLHVIGLLDPRYGGPVVCALSLAGAQHRRGDDVTLVSTDRRFGPGDPAAPLGELDGWEVRVHRAFAPRSWGTSPGLAWDVLRSAARSDVVHVHSLYGFHTVVAFFAARLARRTLVVEPHGALTRYHHCRKRWKKAVYERLVDFPILRRADVVRCASERERIDLAALGLARRAVVVPHGVALPDGLRCDEAAGSGPPTVLFLGRLHEKKRLDLTVRSFATARASRPDARLRVVGTGDPDAERALRAGVRRSGLGGAVELVGARFGDDRWAEYARASVFVLLSDDESFGLTPIEALACGVPAVVSPAVGSTADLGDAAVLTVADPEEAGRALATALADGELRARARREAPSLRTRYSWRAVASGLDAHYRAARAERSRSAPAGWRAADVVVQGALPDYRVHLVRALRRLDPRPVRVVSGETHFTPTVVAVLGDEAIDLRVVNRYLLGRRLLAQPGAVCPGITAGVAVLEFNPRIVSSWVVLVVRRLLRRPTVLWGHVAGRGGSGWLAARLRRAAVRLSGHLLVYTDHEAREAALAYARARVTSAPNGLYASADARPVEPGPEPQPAFVFSGRLVPGKRCDIAVAAFALARRSGCLPEHAELRLVGDGPERDRLEADVDRLGVAGSVRFLGNIPASDEARVAEVYADALASVCAGYVGLNAIQSLWFGVPVITARGEPHAPEVAALRCGVNAVFAPTAGAAELATCLAAVWRDRMRWWAARVPIAETCREHHSVERTARGLVDAIEGARGAG
jgi:glycosyltransferase involved in cell wall biosynthesis